MIPAASGRANASARRLALLLAALCAWTGAGVLCAAAGARAASLEACLPPLYEGGRRLHGRGEFEVAHLSLLLAQHELCWSAFGTGDAQRVLLVGNSNVWGHPLLPAESYAEILQQRLDASGRAARVYNLGFLGTYQLKDALVLSQALRFAPDLIVYGASLADARHVVPILWPPELSHFFEVNGRLLTGPDAPALAGLEEAARVYAADAASRARWSPAWVLLQEGGRYLRVLLRERTRSLLAAHLLPSDHRGPLAEETPRPLRQRDDRYACEKVLERFAVDFAGWEEWSILPYLEAVQQRTGVPVLVVNWPVARVPSGACYNARFPAQAVEAFNERLARETQRRGLAYLDVHDLVAADSFTDWMHLDAAGQARLAAALAPEIEGRLRSGFSEASPASRAR